MTSDADFIHMGALTVNLATYQVKVNGEPIDLTFMEYALLSFLVTHPGRIYSREVPLSQVWGFDYYGGSRTVDVHVRRLRAKLGPEVASTSKPCVALAICGRAKRSKPMCLQERRKDQPVGWSFLLKGEGLKERFASEATFSGLAQVFVDHVARVHAGAKGKGRRKSPGCRSKARSTCCPGRHMRGIFYSKLEATRNKSCSIWWRRSRPSNSESAGMFCGIYFIFITWIFPVRNASFAFVTAWFFSR